LLIPNINALASKHNEIQIILERFWEAGITILNKNGNVIDPDLWRLVYSVHTKSNIKKEATGNV
jgi:hypothetical protein